MTNKLYYGDNLDVLRNYIASESVDLIYLDPPFNSNANYNILFKSPTGKAAESQIEAFEDSWHWNDSAEAAFHDVMVSGNTDVAELLRAMRGFLKENDMMAYLAMMAVRLIELHRVLKPTGSLYLHCDPTASHYLKLLLDGVFGADRFRNEIIWKRTGSHGGSRRWGPIHDTIFFYSKGIDIKWNRVCQDYNPDYLEKFYRFSDSRGRYRLVTLTGAGIRKGESGAPWRGVDPSASGRHWAVPATALARAYPDVKLSELSVQERLELLDSAGLIYWPPRGTVPQQKRYVDEADGVLIQDMITDIGPISSQAQERLGYPTQKPLALLERIINASSNPGDVVLDPFCGCGTAVHAAHKLGRQWIGIDITHLAIGLIERRLKEAFPGIAFEVVGEPKDLASAERLAAEEPHQFQYWITQKIDGQPYQGGRKGADRGIDGYIYFTGHDRKTEAAIVSVKAGRNVGVAMVRDLKGVIEREKAPIGVFVCVIAPTRAMEAEAASAGVYEAADGRSYPRLQIFTLAEIFLGHRPKIPLLDRQAGFKQASRESTGKQGSLL